MSIDFKEATRKCLDNLMKRYENRGIPKFSTGFYDLDIALSGLPKS